MGTEKKARAPEVGPRWSGGSKLSSQTWGYIRNQMLEWDLHGAGVEGVKWGPAGPRAEYCWRTARCWLEVEGLKGYFSGLGPF